jgi:transcriptional regulator GlxA family with amidase domain
MHFQDNRSTLPLIDFSALEQRRHLQPLKVRQALASLEQDLPEIIDFDRLAASINLSRRHLERLFKKHVGCSPSRYYLQLRLNHAHRLLRARPQSIQRVATECGFGSSAQFCQSYRKHFGNILPVDPLTRAHLEDRQAPKLSSSLVALTLAQDEPTFASFRL